MIVMAAFITWLVTAGGGLCLVAIWVIEFDQSAAASLLPRTVVSAHGLLAVVGLGAWAGYLITDRSKFAWAAVATLGVVMLLGLTMAVRWISVYRAHRTPLPVLVPIGAHGAVERAPASPPERHLPLPLVLAHGLLAGCTVVLVLLSALDVVGS